MGASKVTCKLHSLLLSKRIVHGHKQVLVLESKTLLRSFSPLQSGHDELVLRKEHFPYVLPIRSAHHDHL